MKRSHRLAVLALVMSVLLTSSGCINRFDGEGTKLNTGRPITPEEIDSIFDAISASVTEKYPTETDADGDLIVYWLEGGSVWHASALCGSISNSESGKIHIGKITDAIANGKKRACKNCSEDCDITVDLSDIATSYISDITTSNVDRYPKEYDDNGVLIVYWLQNGSVWHESSQCGTVLNSSPDKVIIGNPYEAFVAGKSRACKVCSSDSTIVTDDWVIITENVTEETTEPIERYPKEYDANGELIVYWLENGSVWHESSQCGTILKAQADKVQKGTPYEAYNVGKDRACKVCSSDSTIVTDDWAITTEIVTEETTQPIERYPKEYSANGELIVFWLESGSVWHESSQCGTILKASPDKVQNGTPYEAYYAGKTRACKICSGDSVTVIDKEALTVNTSAEETTVAIENYPKNYDNNGNLIVYWLESGSVWHESIYCSVLSDISHDRIISGSVSEAILSQKESACKKCSQ